MKVFSAHTFPVFWLTTSSTSSTESESRVLSPHKRFDLPS